MASNRVSQQLENLRKKGLKEIYNPTKGLMDILKESRDIESESGTRLSGILDNIVELKESQSTTFEKMDFGVGKIAKIVSDAIASVSPDIKPAGDNGNSTKFFQSSLEYFSLIEMQQEDELQLTRGILFNVTQIHGILQRAEKHRELLKDKKTFKMPKKDKKKDDAKSPPYDWSDFFKALGSIAGIASLLLKPLKWLGGMLWKAVKSVFKGVSRGLKRRWISFLKAFKKTFPKAYEFTKRIKSTIDDFFKKLTSKMPKFADDAVKGISGFFKKGIGKALKVIGKAAFWIDMAYSFFQGIFNASAITGKDQVDLKDKIISGVMGMLSSLTFGFVKAEDWYDVVMGEFGLWYYLKEALQGIWEMMPDSIKKVFKGVGDMFSFAYEEADKVFKQFSGGWSMAKTLSKLLDDVAIWIEKTVSWKNLNPFSSSKEDEDGVPDVDPIAARRIKMAAAKRAEGRNLPKNINSSESLHLANKAAAEKRKIGENKTLVNVPPPTVIQTPPATQVNMFEPDQMAILIGGTK